MAGSFDISADGNTIYAHSNDYKIYMSVNGGMNWTNHQIFTSGYSIAVSPTNSERVIYGEKEGLYLSVDGLSSVIKILDIDAIL